MAIFRNRFDDDIVALNIDALSSVDAVAVRALARAEPAINSAALVAVDCTTMMIAATMMMMLMPTLMSRRQTTFDCCENLIEPSEMKRTRERNEEPSLLTEHSFVT